MNIESAAEALIEQFPSAERADLLRKSQQLERFGRIAFGGFSVVLLIGVLAMIYAIITNMILTGQRPWFGSLLIAFIVLASLSLTWVVLNEDLKEKLAEARRPAELPNAHTAETGKLLTDPVDHPISSVTEGTTELLTAKNKTQKH